MVGSDSKVFTQTQCVDDALVATVVIITCSATDTLRRQYVEKRPQTHQKA